MKQIPNLFTLLNLFFGSLAIIFILQQGIDIVADDNGVQYVQFPEKLWMASLCIGIAAVVDFLDGFVARLLKASSEMGKQLDSLADVVSFGVAPGMIMYQFLRLAFAAKQDGLETNIIWLLPALIIPCAAAYRLAKFNIDTEQTYHFKGVPTPAVGILIASFPLIYWNNDEVVEYLKNQWVLYGIIAFVSYAMVSNWYIMSMKFRDYSLKNNIPKIIMAVVAIASGFIFHWLAVPIVFIAYIILSLIFKPRNKI